MLFSIMRRMCRPLPTMPRSKGSSIAGVSDPYRVAKASVVVGEGHLPASHPAMHVSGARGIFLPSSRRTYPRQLRTPGLHAASPLRRWAPRLPAVQPPVLLLSGHGVRSVSDRCPARMPAGKAIRKTGWAGGRRKNGDQGIVQVFSWQLSVTRGAGRGRFESLQLSYKNTGY